MVTFVTDFFIHLKFSDLSLSRTVVIVNGLLESSENIGTHDTKSELASHCGKTFQSRISTF